MVSTKNRPHLEQRNQVLDTMIFSFWIVANTYLYFDVVVQIIHIILEICLTVFELICS